MRHHGIASDTDPVRTVKNFTDILFIPRILCPTGNREQAEKGICQISAYQAEEFIQNYVLVGRIKNPESIARAV
jgi:hypothetical protein